MKSGSPTEEPADASDLRVAIVAARWHEQVMDGLLAGAVAACAAYKVLDPLVVRAMREGRTEAESPVRSATRDPQKLGEGASDAG